MMLGIDTGGTFTDFVCYDGLSLRFHKVLSTPDDPSRAIFKGIGELGLVDETIHLVHGSTVATNAILEKKGARVLLVTQRGMEDLLFIGRQNRMALFDLCPEQPEPWLHGDDCFGVSARTDSNGSQIGSMRNDELLRLIDLSGDYDSVAVCLLFSFLSGSHEMQVKEALPDRLFVSLSHEVVAEYREYERASTTFINAYVGPLVERYLGKLERGIGSGHLHIMHSAGGVMPAGEAGEQAVRLVLSGPAGGLVAAQKVGQELGIDRLLTFDMGGTSTDVALIDGSPVLTTEGSVAGMPVSLPMLDIHTIGAGGGSLAWLDAAGLPQVGPESAGANPGPACYGQGGISPTVTDANVILGRIPSDAALAGTMKLDVSAAREAVAKVAGPLGLSVEEAALGIIRIAEEHMAGALRVVSVQRGHDPAGFALLCFGGAGGLHACAVAELVNMHEVIMPVGSGAFSAFGMLAGRRKSELSRSRRLMLGEAGTKEAADEIFEQLKTEAASKMQGMTLEYELRVDLRYVGQGFHLTLPYRESPDQQLAEFEEAHASAYGHQLKRKVEMMTLRLSAFGDAPAISLPEAGGGAKVGPRVTTCRIHGAGDVPCYRRNELGAGFELTGPALVVEETATLWLPSGWSLEVSEHGHLLLERSLG